MLVSDSCSEIRRSSCEYSKVNEESSDDRRDELVPGHQILAVCYDVIFASLITEYFCRWRYFRVPIDRHFSTSVVHSHVGQLIALRVELSIYRICKQYK